MALQVDKVLKEIRDKHGHVHGVANCIGDASIMKPTHITSEVGTLLVRTCGQQILLSSFAVSFFQVDQASCCSDCRMSCIISCAQM